MKDHPRIRKVTGIAMWATTIAAYRSALDAGNAIFVLVPLAFVSWMLAILFAPPSVRSYIRWLWVRARKGEEAAWEDVRKRDGWEQ